MSHYNVAVFTESHDADINSLLLPYMENCCGTPLKEYMEFNDSEYKMEEMLAHETETRVKMPDGRLLHITDEEFRIPGTVGVGNKTHKVPDNYEIVEVPMSQLYASIEDFAREYYGLRERDPETGRYGYWQNPNATWDWYEIGGRWSGMLIVKDENDKHVVLGDALCGSRKGKNKKLCDGAYVRNIDFDAMKEKALKMLVPYAESKKNAEQILSIFEKEYPSEEIYIAKSTAFTTFAVVTPDGEWYEFGTLGCWGFSSDTPEDSKKWIHAYDEDYIKPAIENNWFMTIVDCHI